MVPGLKFYDVRYSLALKCHQCSWCTRRLSRPREITVLSQIDMPEKLEVPKAVIFVLFNPLNAELSPFCHLLALLGAHHILHVSRMRVERRVKSHLPSAGIIRNSPHSPR